MDTDTQLEFYSPTDAAQACQCCAATVKRIADELRLPVIRTRGGVRLFTSQQVERIQQERIRRAKEAASR
jgi:DNA-binding transcriptional MerR regulator